MSLGSKWTQPLVEEATEEEQGKKEQMVEHRQAASATKRKPDEDGSSAASSECAPSVSADSISDVSRIEALPVPKRASLLGAGSRLSFSTRAQDLIEPAAPAHTPARTSAHTPARAAAVTMAASPAPAAAVEEEEEAEEQHKQHEAEAEEEEDEEIRNSMTFSQFLFLSQVRFLDNLSSKRRTTMAMMAPKPKTLVDKVRVGSAMLPELEAMEDACEYLSKITEESKERVKQLEVETDARNPRLFHLLQEADEAQMAELQRNMAKLKGDARNEAKYRWHVWRAKFETNLQQQLQEEYDALSADRTQLDRLNSVLVRATKEFSAAQQDMQSRLPEMRASLRSQDELMQLEELQQQSCVLDGKNEDAQHQLAELIAKRTALESTVAALRDSRSETEDTLQTLETDFAAASTPVSVAGAAEKHHIYGIVKSLVPWRLEATTENDFTFKFPSVTIAVKLGSTIVEGSRPILSIQFSQVESEMLHKFLEPLLTKSFAHCTKACHLPQVC